MLHRAGLGQMPGYSVRAAHRVFAGHAGVDQGVINSPKKAPFIGDLAHLGERQTEVTLLSQPVQWLRHCLSAYLEALVSNSSTPSEHHILTMLAVFDPQSSQLNNLFVTLGFTFCLLLISTRCGRWRE